MCYIYTEVELFHVSIYKNGDCVEYNCRDCGWKDSTTLVITMCKTHIVRVSLLNVDRIEIKEDDD